MFYYLSCFTNNTIMKLYERIYVVLLHTNCIFLNTSYLIDMKIFSHNIYLKFRKK